MRAGLAVGIDDALGEQVRHGLSRDGFVGSVNVVKAAVFPDDHDHMLNRSSGGGMFLSGDRGRRSQVDEQSKQTGSNREVLSGLRQKTRRHDFLLRLLRRTTDDKLSSLPQSKGENANKRNSQVGVAREWRDRWKAEQFAL